MADEEVLFDDVYELCEIIGKWVSSGISLYLLFYDIYNNYLNFFTLRTTVRVVNRSKNVCAHTVGKPNRQDMNRI